MRKPPADMPQTQSIRLRVRAAGLRSTAARLAVLRELLAARSPLTHAQVAARLARRGFDRATIYRNLIELADAGLLLRVELGDHVWRFEARRDAADGPAEHPHFLCVDCGEVSCLSSVNVRITPAPGGTGSVIGQVTEVLLKGHCGRCA